MLVVAYVTTIAPRHSFSNMVAPRKTTNHVADPTIPRHVTAQLPTLLMTGRHRNCCSHKPPGRLSTYKQHHIGL